MMEAHVCSGADVAAVHVSASSRLRDRRERVLLRVRRGDVDRAEDRMRTSVSASMKKLSTIEV